MAIFGIHACYGSFNSFISSSLEPRQHHPSLIVSCCNPGFIETDLSRSHAEQMGKTPAELGMLAVEQGAVVPCKLVLEDLGERGLYYGSDGKACGLAEVDPNDFES